MNTTLNKNDRIAVIGVSDNPSKFGHKVYFDLISKGYQVYAVHPDEGEVLGFKRFKKLSDLPVVPDVVNIVTQPSITEAIVRECKELGIKKVWMQPGSESEEAIAFCRDNEIEALHSACIMVENQ